MVEELPALPAPLYRTLAEFRGALSDFTHANAAKLRRGGLTPQQFALMVLIGSADEGALRVGQAAQELHLAHNSAVGLSQRAQKAGLVLREADPERGQVTLLRLSALGARKLDRVTRMLIAELGDERQELIEALTRWNALLEASGSRNGPLGGYEFRRAEAGERPLLRNLLQLYLHELSPVLHVLPDDSGVYPYPDFDLYWQGEAAVAYLMRVERHPAGFALVRDAARRAVEELYVLPAHRGYGLGRRMVGDLLDERAGDWSVSFPARCVGARRFWERVLARDKVGVKKRISGADPAGRGVFEFSVSS